ncbi:MAG: nicotinate phosphoribosyltransferase [Saprospiraceae bacterium]|jgi:nicotinate phosphoribosyltransferase
MKEGSISKLYRHNLTLLTDLYQLTMANGYWQNSMYHHEAVFHLFYRKNPFKNGFAIAAGLEQVIDYLQNLRFDVDDIRYLANLKGTDNQALFEEGFLNFLQRFKFTCDVDAVPEGTIVFPHEPLIRIKGNLIQAQLVETALLTMINFQTLIATKSARIKAAAGDDIVMEFGLRRAQGIDGGLSASRAAYIGGCDSTSNVLAGKLFDIPVKGTHAHSWVMCFENELEAFSAYANAMPNNTTLLVDTYDTIEGVKYAVEIGTQLRQKGFDLAGIRLDSGDLATLSIEARKILDAAGFENSKIVASNDLDEYRIKTLKEKGAKITVWGVGTRLATAYDQPALGGVYKLGAIKSPTETEWNYRIKLSEQAIKVSNPGILQVHRYFDNHSAPIADVIFNEDTESNTDKLVTFDNEIVDLSSFKSKKLLRPIFRNGQLIYELPNIHAIRNRAIEQLKGFDRKTINEYKIGLENTLYKRKKILMNR